MKVIFAGLIVFIASTLFAQEEERSDMTDVTFEQLYDEPFNVNKLFIGVQPFYGELFATNVNAGFGVDAHYYHKNKVDFRAHLRKTYSSRFFDMSRENALKNSSVQNVPETYNYFELGMTWHVKDFEEPGKTKLVLYKKSYAGNRWASRVPLRAEVPCKVRKIYGARFGGIVWNSTLDVSHAFDLANKTNLDFGAGAFDNSINIFSNIYAAGIYAGGSMTWIRNVAASFDQYDSGLDDGMLTLYADILYSPYLKIRDVKYQDINYNTGILKLNSFGFRAGLDGKFNRKLSWGYGGEFGYRPSVANMGFFAVIKIAIPLYGTNLNYSVTATPKEAGEL